MVNLLMGLRNMAGVSARGSVSGAGLVPSAPKGLVPFQRTLTKTDFFDADVAVVAGKFNEIGTFTVAAQQAVTFGQNQPVNGGLQGAQIYIRSDSLAGEVAGEYRLELRNANGTQKFVVAEERSERLSADQNDRNKTVLLAEYSWKALEDSQLAILIEPDASTTIDYDDADTKWLVPVTVYQ